MASTPVAPLGRIHQQTIEQDMDTLQLERVFGDARCTASVKLAAFACTRQAHTTEAQRRQATTCEQIACCPGSPPHNNTCSEFCHELEYCAPACSFNADVPMDSGFVSAGSVDRASSRTQCQQRSAECVFTACAAAPSGTPTGTLTESYELDSQGSDTMSHATDKCMELQDEHDDVPHLLSWYLLQPPQQWPTAEQTAPQDTLPTVTETLAEPSLATMIAATDTCTHRQDELTRIKLMELCREIELKMSVPWNASTPTLERNGHWHSPLDGNAHSELSLIHI